MKISRNEWVLGGGGIVTGAVNGLFGGGGGMIVVPFLTAFAKKPPLVAHATAILIILPVSFVSGVLYLINGYFQTELFLSVCIGVTFGGFLGARALNLLSAGEATLLFAAVMFAAGVRMIF